MITTEEIRRVVVEYFINRPVKRAYLFGSWTRGEATADSDVDVLVELDYAAEPSLLDLIEMQQDLQRALGVGVDLVSAGGLHPRVAPYVHADKRLLYASAA